MTHVLCPTTKILMPIPLLDAIEEFGKTLKGVHDYRKPAKALNQCGYASERFADFLSERDIRSQLVGCVHYIAKRPLDLLPPYTDRDREDWRHMFVEVDGIYVDWTARQFGFSQPVPHIFEDRYLVRHWGRIERFDP